MHNLNHEFILIAKDLPHLYHDAIMVAYRGSHAHDTYLSPETSDSIDDVDTMSIVIPGIEYYFGVRQFGSRGTIDGFHGRWDCVSYEFLKFIRLLVVGNPNVLSMLWMDPEMYIKLTPAGEMIISERDAFTGKHTAKSFIGYASGQLHRMTHQRFEGYMGEKRKALVEKYGYDCKNASHCLRILRMGIEFLETGKLNVKRPDAGELIDVKCGRWSLEQVKAEAESLLDRARVAEQRSQLPPGPDMKRIDALCVQVLKTSFGLV